MPKLVRSSRGPVRALTAALGGCLFLWWAPPADAKIFGLKSTGSVSSGSEAPTALFSFDEDGATASLIGNVTIGDTEIDADALALSAIHGLFAYQLAGGNSQLIEIDPTNGDAAVVGSALVGRNIRAAGFSLSDRLWVLDAASNDLLEIDPTTGAVIGSPVNLTLDQVDFVIESQGSDLVFAGTGDTLVISSDSAYALDLATGELSLLFLDNVLQPGNVPIFLVGAAFTSSGAGVGDLFVLDVNGEEDLFTYPNATLPRATYDDDIFNTFNAGRGDLASVPASLDIDGNGRFAPLTDALLVLRHLSGLTGPALVTGIVGKGCTRCDAPAIAAYITAIDTTLDVDGNGELDALTDALLILRFLFGFTGATLDANAVGENCARCDAADIVQYLQNLS